MYSKILSKILNLNITHTENSWYKAEDGSCWEIIPETLYSDYLTSYKEEIIDFLKEELRYSDFDELEDYVNWNQYFDHKYSLIDFGWEEHRLDDIKYYIKQY